MNLWTGYVDARHFEGTMQCGWARPQRTINVMPCLGRRLFALGQAPRSLSMTIFFPRVAGRCSTIWPSQSFFYLDQTSNRLTFEEGVPEMGYAAW